jgi:hypothetical protein
MHQILQWHHLLTGAGGQPATTVDGLEADALDRGLNDTMASVPRGCAAQRGAREPIATDAQRSVSARQQVVRIALLALRQWDEKQGGSRYSRRGLRNSRARGLESRPRFLAVARWV